MKKNLMIKIIGLAYLTTSLQIAVAQDFTYSQFYEMPLMRNPALAGIFNGHLRMQTSYRNQWAAITVPYRTQSLSVEYKRKMGGESNDYITMGLQVNSDLAGDSKLGRIEFLPVFNYHKLVNEDYSTYLSVAFMGGVIQNKFDPSGLYFDDQFQNNTYNPLNTTSQTFPKTNYTYIDGSTGVSLNGLLSEGADFYVGVAGYHLLKSKMSYFTNDDKVFIKPRYVLNGGLNINVGDFNNTTFFADHILQGGHKQTLLGFLYNHTFPGTVDVDDEFKRTGMIVGCAYRWADAVVPVAKLEVNKFFIGASYDVNISKLSPITKLRGGLEVTLSYKTLLNVQLLREDPVLKVVICPLGRNTQF